MQINRQDKRDTRWDDLSQVSEDPIFPNSVTDYGTALQQFAREVGEDREILEKRVAVNRLLDRPAEIRRENRTTIIPVMMEKMVLVKRLVLTEEIHLSTVSAAEER